MFINAGTSRSNEEDHEHQNMNVSDDDCELSKAASFDTIYEGTLDDNFGDHFDIHAAKDYLRNYANRLKSQHERGKRNQVQNQLKRKPGNIDRFEHLYELGKKKVTLERNFDTHPRHPLYPKPEHVPPSATEVINRLYEKSRVMQRDGRHRREEIDRVRGLSNLVPHNKSPMRKKLHSLHSLRSPDSLAQRGAINRLYSLSKPMQNIGRGRRDCIANKAFSQPALFKLLLSRPPTPTEIHGSSNHRTDLRESLTPEEVMDRLYGRSATTSRMGRERREQIKTRSLSQPRLLVNTVTTPLPSPFNVRFIDTIKSRDYPSPTAVMARLYGRSTTAQKNGRERRDKIQVRTQSDPRMFCYSKPSPSPNPTRIKDTHKDPHKDTIKAPESFSPQKVIDRLYGRSYRSQVVGRERREEIDKVRALSNTRSPIRVKCSTPTSRDNSRSRSPSMASTSGTHDFISPEEIANRLYGRSMHAQQAGKDRREKVDQMRCTSLPRLNLHCTSYPSPAKLHNFSFESSPSHLISLEDTVKRLYGRSLQNQEVGKERRNEINRMREMSQARAPIKLRDSSPSRYRIISPETE